MAKRSFNDWFQIFAVCCGAFGGGALIYVGPEGMAEEIPYHKEIGLGLVAVGVLFLVALVNVRAKALMIALTSGLVGSGALFAAVMGDMPAIQAFAIGTLGVLTLVFALYSLVSVITGTDPSGDE